MLIKIYVNNINPYQDAFDFFHVKSTEFSITIFVILDKSEGS